MTRVSPYSFFHVLIVFLAVVLPPPPSVSIVWAKRGGAVGRTSCANGEDQCRGSWKGSKRWDRAVGNGVRHPSAFSSIWSRGDHTKPSVQGKAARNQGYPQTGREKGCTPSWSPSSITNGQSCVASRDEGERWDLTCLCEQGGTQSSAVMLLRSTDASKTPCTVVLCPQRGERGAVMVTVLSIAQGRVKHNGTVPVPGSVSRFSLVEVSSGSWERKNWQLGRMSLHFPSSCSRLNDVPYLAFLTDRRNLMAETVTA